MKLQRLVGVLSVFLFSSTIYAGGIGCASDAHYAQTLNQMKLIQTHKNDLDATKARIQRVSTTRRDPRALRRLRRLQNKARRMEQQIRQENTDLAQSASEYNDVLERLLQNREVADELPNAAQQARLSVVLMARGLDHISKGESDIGLSYYSLGYGFLQQVVGRGFRSFDIYTAPDHPEYFWIENTNQPATEKGGLAVVYRPVVPFENRAKTQEISRLPTQINEAFLNQVSRILERRHREEERRALEQERHRQMSNAARQLLREIWENQALRTRFQQQSRISESQHRTLMEGESLLSFSMIDRIFTWHRVVTEQAEAQRQNNR